jgi:acetyl-CoA synthetase
MDFQSFKKFSSDTSTLFSWDKEVQQVILENNGFINICYEALDRHLETKSGEVVAIKYLPSGDSSSIEYITYSTLIRKSCQFGHMLKAFGFKKSVRVFLLLPQRPELFTAFFGTLRIGGVCSILFSAFGPEPIKTRLDLGKAKVLVTLASYYWSKIHPVRQELDRDLKIFLIDDVGKGLNNIPEVLDFSSNLIQFSPSLFIEKTSSEDPALIQFTSGTTGAPKGALHVHAAVVYHKITSQYALDFQKGDLVWCTADPGWVTGVSYGIIAPLCHGLTILVDSLDFNSERWFENIKKYKVNVWYTAPTALRMMMRTSDKKIQKFDLSSIRFAASVGEPLNPEIIFWCRKNLHLEIHDTWWQTETGGIMICNFPRTPIKEGSMGKPFPGLNVKLIQNVEDSQLSFVDQPHVTGEIAIETGWPSMFRNYIGNETRFKKSFIGEWYLTGDLAYFDEDGHFWFVGRKDDIIKTGGHLVGPFEVESILLEHPSVVDTAVIGVPDPILGEMVKAFVTLREGVAPDGIIKKEILAFARRRLGAVIAPKEISFLEDIPKTKSGKVMRRLLKAKELNLPEGDISAMEIRI